MSTDKPIGPYTTRTLTVAEAIERWVPKPKPAEQVREWTFDRGAMHWLIDEQIAASKWPFRD